MNSSPVRNAELPSLYLASQSPRRAQLLEALGLPYKKLDVSVDEAPGSVNTIQEVVKWNAVLKGRAGLPLLPRDRDIVLGADTLVVIQDEVLGKPRDPEDALRMLRRLSGATHQVWSGLFLASRENGELTRAVLSEVTFHKLSEETIGQYITTREPYDKAGSYAVQGLSTLFIDKIAGSYTNVMGLPMECLLESLTELTSISIFEWFR